MFASQIKRQVTIEEVTYDIRKLSWHSLDKARDASMIANAAHVRAMGGEIFKEIRSEAGQAARKARDAKLATPEGKAKERYANYDREEVLVAGVTGWSRAGVAVSRETLKDLEEPVAVQLHREILDLSLPAAEVQEAEGKEDSGASTSS